MKDTGLPFDFQIVRSYRRTAAIQITPHGQVIVRCPAKMPERMILQFLKKHIRWIERNLSMLPPEQPAFSLQQMEAMTAEARKILPNRVRYYAEKMAVSFGRITIRSQKTRWGSCSAAGNLNFNCLLMQAPPEIQDYVVVHELSHRLQMNHSAQFWAEVEKVLPDYRERRKWLKVQGSSLIARLPGK